MKMTRLLAGFALLVVTTSAAAASAGPANARMITTAAAALVSTAFATSYAAATEVSGVLSKGAGAATTKVLEARSNDVNEPRVVGYFTQRGIYERGYRVKNVEASGAAGKLTHINYAFGNVRDGRCEVGANLPTDPDTGAGGDAYADYSNTHTAEQSVDGVADVWNQPLRGNWNQLKKLKAKHPNLKVLIALGGWTWSRGFGAAAQPENRAAFVASCVDAYVRGNLPAFDNAGGAAAAAGVFDGFDIDWEHPAACGLSCGTSADTDNYTALLAEFRKQLDAVRPGLLLTTAVSAGIDKIRVTRPDQYQRSVDFINVMTYDVHGSWEGTTNHHAALYGAPADPSVGDARLYNTDDALQAFLSRGVPAAKLNIGIGAYGRGWTNVPSTNNGLYRTGSAARGTSESGMEDYRVLSTLDYPAFDDAVAHAHWIYDGTTFWSFDDAATVAGKMTYAKAKGLGGAMLWELGGDDANSTLVHTMAAGLR